MATKKKEIPALEPVSAELNIQAQLLDKPSGDVRGTVIAFDHVKGKWKRLAHVYLLTDEPAAISLENVGRKLSLDEMARYQEIMALFYATVKELDAQRTAS